MCHNIDGKLLARKGTGGGEKNKNGNLPAVYRGKVARSEKTTQAIR